MTAFVSVLTLILAASTYAASTVFRSYLAPSVLWLAAWTSLFALTAGFGGPFQIASAPLLVLFIGVLAFPCGAIFASAIRKPSSPGHSDMMLLLKISPWVMSGALLFGLLGAAILSNALGMPLFSFRSFRAAFDASAENAGAIFRGEAVYPLSAKLCFVMLQVGFIFAGIQLALRRGASFYSLLAGLLITVLIWTIITTQRSNLVVAISWLIGGAAAAVVASRREAAISRPSLVFKAALAAFIIAVTIIAVHAIRLKMTDVSQVRGLLDYVRPWFAGYLPAFSAWYSDKWNGQIDLGRSLFGADMGQLRWDNMVDIGDGRTSNAVTSISIFIRSFGVLGSIGFVMALGFVSQRTYVSCRSRSAIGWATYTLVVATILWSPNMWFLSYGSRVAAAFVPAAIILLAKAVMKPPRTVRLQLRPRPHERRSLRS